MQNSVNKLLILAKDLLTALEGDNPSNSTPQTTEYDPFPDLFISEHGIGWATTYNQEIDWLTADNIEILFSINDFNERK